MASKQTLFRAWTIRLRNLSIRAAIFFSFAMSRGVAAKSALLRRKGILRLRFPIVISGSVSLHICRIRCSISKWFRSKKNLCAVSCKSLRCKSDPSNIV